MFLAMGNDDDADDGHVVKGRVKFLSAVYFFLQKTKQFLTYFASLHTPKCKLSS